MPPVKSPRRRTPEATQLAKKKRNQKRREKLKAMDRANDELMAIVKAASANIKNLKTMEGTNTDRARAIAARRLVEKKAISKRRTDRRNEIKAAKAVNAK